MTITRKALAAAGFLALSAVAITPAVASADPSPQMYQSCSADQEGQDATSSTGDTLECVGVDTGTGYDWETPTS